MDDYIVITDDCIDFFNRGSDDTSKNIIYRDESGGLHEINLKACTENFAAENPNFSDKCVGERNILEWCYIFYTSGIKTKVVFKKRFVRNSLFIRRRLVGSKSKRFHELGGLINQVGFTTYDLS